MLLLRGFKKIPSRKAPKNLLDPNMRTRIRIGDYRVIYNLMAAALVIEVIRVRHRRQAYGR